MANYITLAGLNDSVRDLPQESGLIQPDEIMTSPLLNALRPRIQQVEFSPAGNWQFYIETEQAMDATIHYDNADIPYPGDTDGVIATAPLREVIVNAGLTHGALMRARGMPGSWFSAVRRALEHRQMNFDQMLNRSLALNGTGAVARIVSVNLVGTTLTVTCDNAAYDTGVDNVQHIKKGMKIEVYASDLTTQRDDTAGATSWEVTGVTYTPTRNAAYTTSTGTFTIETDSGHGFADNDVVFIYPTKSSAVSGPFFMGLLAWIQDGSHYTGNAWQLATYCGQTRSSYDSLIGLVWDAADFASGGVAGTADDWNLSTISKAFNTLLKGSGKGIPNLLLCDSDLAMAITRRQKSEGGININVSTSAGVGDQQGSAVGDTFAGRFLAPAPQDRKVWVPIAVCDTIPPNTLYGVNTNDLIWGTKDGGFRNWAPILGLSAQPGDVWMKSPGDRKTNFEAPFGGFIQIVAKRCDRMFCIRDMLDNL